MPKYDKNLIINLDGVTYSVSPDGTFEKVLIVHDSDDEGEPVTTARDDELGMYVKVINQISMGRFIAPPIIVLQDKTMEDEARAGNKALNKFLYDQSVRSLASYTFAVF